MPARRCTDCSLNWPAGETTCGKCGGETWFSPSNEPMSSAEAGSIKAHAAFDLWLTTPEGIAAVETARLEGDRREREFEEFEEIAARERANDQG